MNRGVITISESGTVSMPTDTVWMTMQEIADMYKVFGCYVRKAVKAIFKDGILKELGSVDCCKSSSGAESGTVITILSPST